MTGPNFVHYISTRESRVPPPALSFEEALLAGLADDGGLLVPDRFPQLAGKLPDFAGLLYAELAAKVVSSLAGDAFPVGELHGDKLCPTAHRP